MPRGEEHWRHPAEHAEEEVSAHDYRESVSPMTYQHTLRPSLGRSRRHRSHSGFHWWSQSIRASKCTISSHCRPHSGNCTLYDNVSSLCGNIQVQDSLARAKGTLKDVGGDRHCPEPVTVSSHFVPSSHAEQAVQLLPKKPGAQESRT